MKQPLVPAIDPETPLRSQVMPSDWLRVETEIEIEQPQQVVFDYVTTPALWSTWHPATVEVREVPCRPLTTGETILERIAVAGRHDEAQWIVQNCVPPQRWEISTATRQGRAHITYQLFPTRAGCRFRRTLEFRSERWPWRWLDSTLTYWILKRQSAKALQNLRQILAASGDRAVPL